MHQSHSPFRSSLKSSFKSSFASSSSSLSPSLSSSFAPSAYATSSLARASALTQASALRTFDRATLDTALSLNRLQALLDIFDRYLRLPNTPRAFSLYLAALLLVSAGATLYVSLAAKILETQVQLTRMEQQLATAEQQNGDLLWQIARDTNMQTLHTRIEAAGYIPVKEREYVTVSSDPLPLAAQPDAVAPVAHTLSAPAAQRAPSAWQAFFAQRWHTTPSIALPAVLPTALPATLRSSQVSLPAASDGNPAADRWRLWWEQTLARGAELVHQVAGR